MFLKKLNQRGFFHWSMVAPLVVIALVAVVGVKVLNASHADTPSYTQYLVTSSTSISNTLSRGNPANVSGGLIYGPGFTITGVQNTSFELVANQVSQGVGFYTSSGGLSAGQTDTIQTYINPNKTNGVYTGSYTLKYYNQALQAWYVGPTISYTIDLVNSYYTDYLKVNTTAVSNILSRGNPANVSGGLIYGPGFTITGVQLSGFTLYANTPSQGVGFYTTSGGIGAGQTDTIQTYINPNKANGVYTGNYTLKYYNPTTQQWISGPTIDYTIALVNTYYTDYVKLSSLTTTVSLSRSSTTENNGGLLMATKPTITALQSTGFEIDYNQPTQGVGFYESSGGLNKGQTLDLQAYINPSSKTNGLYTGSATLKYLNSAQQWVAGPTIFYNITLTN